jgi:8-oxo-dGTP pyrophosphatase MutT (NUDIX family)/DNA-binding XRE family transcriptional regulator
LQISVFIEADKPKLAVCHWIKNERDRLGLSQEQLAELLSWSVHTLGRVERGTRQLAPNEIRYLANTLGLSDEEAANIVLQQAGFSNINMKDLIPRTREEERFEIETHVGGVCIRQAQHGPEILIAKRLPTRTLYPNKWECGGGQVRPGENFEEAIRRQMREEFHITVTILATLGTYHILAPQLHQKKIPGVVFLCGSEAKSKTPAVVLNRKEFSEYKWITPSEAASFDLIEGVKRDIQLALSWLQEHAPGRDQAR